MGKAKRKLEEARKALNHIEIPVRNESELDNSRDVIFEKDYLINTAILLRRRLVQYVESEGYPMCEFLDLENMTNYIDWCLSK